MKIEVNEKQMEVIEKALDFYSRIMCAQFEEIDRVFRHEGKLASEYSMEVVSAILRRELFPNLPPKASISIMSNDISEKAKIAYDLYQVVRNSLVPENKSISVSEPLRVSKEPLPRIQ